MWRPVVWGRDLATPSTSARPTNTLLPSSRPSARGSQQGGGDDDGGGARAVSRLGFGLSGDAAVLRP
jgi:hypothetical protein